jgi:F1F0 ATPase subunit 2
MLEMKEMIQLAAALLAGGALGALYFGSLWWTLLRMPRCRRPLSLYFASLAVRLTVVLAAFYGLLTAWDWDGLIAALLGFIGARILLTRLARHASFPKSTMRRAET